MRGGTGRQYARKSHAYATTRKPKALAVEVMAKLVAEGAEEGAERGDLFPDGGPHPETDKHRCFGLSLACAAGVTDKPSLQA